MSITIMMHISSKNVCLFKVTRDSVKEQIFDVSHLDKVKEKLKSLLAGEIVPISEMVHDTEPKEASVEDEGNH